MTHFHGYAYTGTRYSDPEVRSRRVPEGYLPIEIKDTTGPSLRLPTLDDALAWLENELTVHRPADADTFPVESRLAYSRARLQQSAGAFVVYGYWTQGNPGKFVARRILPCTHCSG